LVATRYQADGRFDIEGVMIADQAEAKIRHGIRKLSMLMHDLLGLFQKSSGRSSSPSWCTS
jgi:hypothetical protein